jgi:hypothetical protein
MDEKPHHEMYHEKTFNFVTTFLLSKYSRELRGMDDDWDQVYKLNAPLLKAAQIKDDDDL